MLELNPSALELSIEVKWSVVTKPGSGQDKGVGPRRMSGGTAPTIQSHTWEMRARRREFGDGVEVPWQSNNNLEKRLVFRQVRGSATSSLTKIELGLVPHY